MILSWKWQSTTLSVQSVCREICDFVAALVVLLYSYSASFYNDNESGGGPVVSQLKSPPWLWAATNNPTRDYCTAGWRDSRAPVWASACCHPREATLQPSIHSQPSWGRHRNSGAAWKAPTRDTEWLSCPSPIFTSHSAPPLHPSQIKPLSNFCFPNLWTLTEAPTLERETTQHGMISRWQGEAEKTLLKKPDHPVIFLLLPLCCSFYCSPTFF